LKGVTGGLQFSPQFGVILDDAVVHHRDLLATHVRVRVALRRHAMCCPAGVGNPQGATDITVIQHRLQFGDLAHGTNALQAAILTAHRNPRRIIAPVLEALEAFDKNRNNVTLRDGANNAAHEFCPESND